MATGYLNPDGLATGIAGWNTSYSTTPSHLSQGDTSNEWRTNFNSTGKAIFTLDDFDFSGLNVDSITSIKHQLICGLDARGGTAPITISIRDLSTGLAGTTLYSETHNNAAGAGFQTFTGTARTTSNGSSAWTDSDLDGLNLFFIATGGSHHHLLQQAYIKVSYSTGYGNSVSGVASTNISNISGVASADISNVMGV